MVGCDDPFRKVKRAAVVEKLSPLSEEATTGTSIGRANAGRAQRIWSGEMYSASTSPVASKPYLHLSMPVGAKLAPISL